jgi:hypothetical protein
VHHVDEARTCLYKNLITGRTIRTILAEAGAEILTSQTADDPRLARLNGDARIVAVWQRGQAEIPACLSEATLQALETELDTIHRGGATGMSLTFGNVILDPAGTPWLIDFDGARAHRSTAGPLFAWYRDQDREKFNRIYGRNLLTERSARLALAAQRARLPGWYAPIDFGRGLAVDGFWSVENGTGRWEFLNRAVLGPLVQGKRVLDLGPNNGIMPIFMLRAGAREVVGLELDPLYAESAQLVRRLFEWRDMRPYNLQIHNVDMRAIHDAWEPFDMVTSL